MLRDWFLSYSYRLQVDLVRACVGLLGPAKPAGWLT